MCAVGNDAPHFHLVNEGKGEKKTLKRDFFHSDS